MIPEAALLVNPENIMTKVERARRFMQYEFRPGINLLDILMDR